MPHPDMQAIRHHYDALGRALVVELNRRDIQGGGWTHTAQLHAHGSLSLHHPARLTISLIRLNTHRKGDAGQRLTIVGGYPSGWYGTRTRSITVSVGRSAPQIADEIIRRLLPDYLETLITAMARERIDQAQRQARITMNRRLEAALPALAVADGSPDRTRSSWPGECFAQGPPQAVASGTVYLDNDGSTMTLKLTGVPAELGLHILRCLRSRGSGDSTVSAGVLCSPR
ncbi:hypothetical protein ACIG3E_33650 [Streptomyces sp. NPDC053474]|uniref:hypothetical protein n=1 Tax=Streptomyces sp. NPDC053474 TaxID=3365704 RepID=UPI0037D25592